MAQARPRAARAPLTCWAVIALKPPPGRKSRLAAALDPAAREALVRAMAARVVGAALRAEGIDRVALLAASREDLPPGLALLRDRGAGLNAALGDARDELAANGASRMIAIAADLPLVEPAELARLSAVGAATIAIAPDRHGTGTNALSLPLPAACDFAFAFGPDSFAAHRSEAVRLGLAVEMVIGDGLARDVDTPDDLADAAARPG